MTEKTMVIKIDSKDPNLANIREVARAARFGKIVAFPTETVYGIGAPMRSQGIHEKLAELKNRPEEKHFSYHISEWVMLDFLGIERTPEFRYLTRRFWPGPVTLIVRSQSGGTVGLRFPKNLLANALISAVGEPFIATSANMSGQASATTGAAVLEAFENKIDYIIDSGKTEYQQDSTVVDVSSKEPKILREGVMIEEVRQAVNQIKEGKHPRKKILIVCTGNSCRSPMAEGWLAAELNKQELSGRIEIASCGVGTRDGMPATQEAVEVMRKRGIDISQHQARVCRREDVLESDLIYAMSKEHATILTGLVPNSRGKIKVLNVKDPIGMNINVYEKVIDDIEKKLKNEWNEIILKSD